MQCGFKGKGSIVRQEMMHYGVIFGDTLVLEDPGIRFLAYTAVNSGAAECLQR